MKKTRMNRLFALTLALLMVFMLAACSASSSSSSTTTFSTSKTDENGNTTTNTTTTEVGITVGTDGISTTNQTTTQTTTDAGDGEEDPDPEVETAELTDLMYELYNGGAMGTNADGDVFYYAFNDENDNLMLAIMTEDHSSFTKWHGWADVLDDQTILTGYNEDNYIPFDLIQTEDDVFTLSFIMNGDEADMEVVDYDYFVETFVNDWVYFD